MSSLVSNFIINPVLRQARRLSAGFAAEDRPPAPALLQQHHRTRSAQDPRPAFEDAIQEGGEDGRIPDWALSESGLTAVAIRPLAQPAPAPDDTQPERDIAPEPSRHGFGSGQGASVAGPGAGTAAAAQLATALASNVTPASPPRTPVWINEALRSSTPLPEDDGMGILRTRIRAVQSMDISQSLKARLVHQILLEGYAKSQLSPDPDAEPPLKSESPTRRGVSAHDLAESTNPLQALKFWNPLGDGSGPLDLPLSEEDVRPTYAPPMPVDDFTGSVGAPRLEDHGHPVLGCEHYRRNVKLQCAACERWYTCRFCHDAAQDHVLPRKETKNMLCMLCGCAQRASDTCIRCGESAAYYYCSICKLWNDDPNKSIYHCNDCGLCRVGQGLGKDFFHCKKCVACISMTGLHKCIERSVDCDCPICGEYMFNSPKPVVFMQCGHSIHRRCFDEHMKTSYKCPLCNKSCVNMEYQFHNLDMAIVTQPMPLEYRDTRAIVSCNDCSAKSQTAFHWLGLKCSTCNSYNTVQLHLLDLPGAAASDTPVGSQPAPPVEMLSLGRDMRRAGSRRETTPDPSSPASSSPAPVSSPSSPSRHYLVRLLSRGPAPSASPDPPGTRAARAFPGGVPLGAVSGDHRWAGHDSADDDDDDEDDEYNDVMLNFWGRDDHRNITSAESANGGEGRDGGDGDEDESSSEDDNCDDDDDDDDDEEEDDAIVLLGHR